MNLGEKSAVEAMLGLSRPNHNLTQPSPTQLTCGSSVSPSLSPVQCNHLPRLPHISDFARPKAMRLSQLLTDDSPPPVSPPHVSPLPQPHHHHHHQQQQLQLPHSLHLPLPSSAPTSSAPSSSVMPATEPVTPPFTPPVLPPVSTVSPFPITHQRKQHQQQQQQQQLVHSNTRITTSNPSSTWIIPPPLSIRHNNIVGAPALPPAQTIQRSNNSRPTTENLKKIVKRPYKKYYSNPTPSSHCHVCARTSKAVKFAICARIAEGLCRKVTCYKCFAKFGWDWEAAVNSKTWICVHCRGVCPEGRSQCYIYSRVNSKRESKRKKLAKAKENQQHVAVTPSQNTSQGGVLLPNVVPSGLPPIANIGGHPLHSFIRPV